MCRVLEPRTRRGIRNIASLFTRARGVRRGVALLAAAALLNLSGGAAAAAAATPSPPPSGQVVTAAGLTLDGSPAVQGQTLFPGSTLDTAERGRPSLAFSNLARLELSGGASLRLDFSASSLGCSLDAGGARVYAPPGVAAALTTADASVASDAEAGPALFTVHVSEDGTTLSVQTGRVEMRAGGQAVTASAGQSLRAAQGSAPAPPQGNNLSSRKKAGLFVGIAAALAAVILVIVGRGDNVEDDFGGPVCPLSISPDGSFPPC
jgi:ferric-dicitrate binding protein FerR (iron transport regulator)